MPRTLGDVIDDLGVGFCQARVVFFAGAVYLLGGEIMFFFSTFPVAIALELGLEPYQRAALGSVVFLGMLVGNLACFMNDSFGRRGPILLSISGMLLFAGASALARDFWSIMVSWALVGVVYGIGVPTFNALCMETTPSDWRFSVNAVAMAAFCVASTRAAAILYVYAPDVVSMGQHWAKILFWSCASYSIFMVLAVVPGFVESPPFLVRQRKLTEARDQLEAMQRQNGRPEVSLEFSVESNSTQALHLSESLAIVFGRALWPVTLVLGLTTFLLNFMSYGQAYALPQVLGSVDLGASPAQSMLVATLFDTAGYGLGCALESFMGRKALTLTYLVGAGVFTMILIYGLEVLAPVVATRGAADAPVLAAGAEQGVALVQVGLNGSRLFVSVGWCAAYTYVGEVFPTLARAGGSGVCIACGRFGSLSAPWAFEFLLIRTGTYLWYFLAAGVLCVLNAVLVLLVLRETKGACIDETTSLLPPSDTMEEGHEKT
jgi:putative MFS transporter